MNLNPINEEVYEKTRIFVISALKQLLSSLQKGEKIPATKVETYIEPHLKKGSPYRSWSMIHDLFEYSRITSFKTAEILKKTVVMKHVLNSVTSAQPDNLTAGLSSRGKIDDYHKAWEFIQDTPFCK